MELTCPSSPLVSTRDHYYPRILPPGVILPAQTGPRAAEAVLRQGRLDRGAPPPVRGRGRRGGEQPELEVLAGVLLRGREEEAGEHEAVVREGGVDVVGPAAQLLDGPRGGEPRGGVPAPPRRDQVEIVRQVLVGEGDPQPLLETSPGVYVCVYACPHECMLEVFVCLLWGILYRTPVAIRRCFDVVGVFAAWCVVGSCALELFTASERNFVCCGGILRNCCFLPRFWLVAFGSP